MKSMLIGADADSIRPGATLYRALDDGRELVVYRMIPGQHRLVIGQQGDGGYADGWCYHGLDEVLIALAVWDGEGDPPGRWYRHLGSGRRRQFDADGYLVGEEVPW